MKATISMDGIWGFLQSLSLSSNNKRWLAERLVESRQVDSIELEQEKEMALVRDSMHRAMSEVHSAYQSGASMPNIDKLIAELQ